MNYDVIENSKADLRLSRRKALELLPVLRKRDEGELSESIQEL